LFSHSADAAVAVVSIAIILTTSTEREPRPTASSAWKLRDCPAGVIAGREPAAAFVSPHCVASAALAASRPRESSWGRKLAAPGTHRGNQAGLNPSIPPCGIFAILCSFRYKPKSRLALSVAGKQVREAVANAEAEPEVSLADFLPVF